jgi:hypothetical protein
MYGVCKLRVLNLISRVSECQVLFISNLSCFLAVAEKENDNSINRTESMVLVVFDTYIDLCISILAWLRNDDINCSSAQLQDGRSVPRVPATDLPVRTRLWRMPERWDYICLDAPCSSVEKRSPHGNILSLCIHISLQYVHHQEWITFHVLLYRINMWLWMRITR